MAPFSSAIVDTMYENRALARGLGGNSTGVHLSPSQGNTLQVLAVSFSTISVASAILAFYWFVKMRRSFRHE
jgi:G protein-coupled receptor GPR1